MNDYMPKNNVAAIEHFILKTSVTDNMRQEETRKNGIFK